MTIKVKANEELFNQWQKAGRIITNLASIVQNDMEVEIEDMAEWEQLYIRSLEELKAVHQKTLDYIHDNHKYFTPGLLRDAIKLLEERTQ